MKALLLLAVTLLACTAMGKVLYEIPLPAGPSQSEFFTAGGGDMYYTVGQGGQVFFVNLTSKKVQSTKDFRGTGISGLVGLPTGVLIQLNTGGGVAFDGKGNFVFTSNQFAINTVRPNSYTIIGTTAYIASDSTGTFLTVDLTTGVVGANTIAITAGNVYPTQAILTIPNAAGVPVLTAFSLPAMTQLWAIPNVLHYLGSNSDFFLVTNSSVPQTTQVLVYDRTNLNLVSTLHAMEGVYQSGFTPVIKGNQALFMLGTEVIRLANIDLLTGNIHWELYLGDERGAGTFIGATAYATISKTVLSVIDLTTGKKTISISGVPYTPTHTITSLGNNLLQVANLQGYTIWNIATGAFVSREENAPGASPATSYNWNGLSVYTQGADVVVAQS